MDSDADYSIKEYRMFPSEETVTINIIGKVYSSNLLISEILCTRNIVVILSLKIELQFKYLKQTNISHYLCINIQENWGDWEFGKSGYQGKKNTVLLKWDCNVILGVFFFGSTHKYEHSLYIINFYFLSIGDKSWPKAITSPHNKYLLYWKAW